MSKQYLCTLEKAASEEMEGFFNWNNHQYFTFMFGDNKESFIRCFSCKTVFQVNNPKISIDRFYVEPVNQENDDETL